MKNKLLLSLGMLAFAVVSFGQTVVWSEDFGTPAAGTMANGYNNGNGAWTVTNTGANGADANVWYVSGEECGNAAGACGSVCSGGDASLHIGPAASLGGDVGAAYAAGGLGFFFPETDKRVESPVIDLTGETNLTLNFTYIEDYVGQAGYDPTDDATLWYFDGVVWAQIDPLAITPAGCNPQGTWTAFSVALPASADNNPNVQIGFHWFNNDDNTGSDPSIAVDDIEITTPAVAGPTADFSASATTICTGDCIDFTDMSTVGTNPAWAWTFTGADTPNSAVQNPTNICYSTAGTYQVELTVTDDNGNDTETKVAYITVNDCATPTSSFTPSSTTICVGDCITFTDNSTGAITSWNWTFNGASTPTANTQDPGSICWATDGVFDVDLEVSDGTNTDISTVQITVNPAPNVSATATPGTTICEGESVTLNGSGAVTYAWDNGVTDGVAFTPTVTTTYTVTGTDANMCTRDFPLTVTVEICDSIQAGFEVPDYNLCAGQCITLTDTSAGNVTGWNWDFGGGGTPATSNVQDPTVCFDTPGTFNIQLTVTDAAGNNSSQTQTVSVFGSPAVNAQLDTIIDLGGEAALIANGSTPGTYQWFPSNVDCDTCAITFASPWGNTDYIVTLTDVNGCSAQDTVQVYVNFIEGIGVPSAFSPNGDGHNDVLYVKGIGLEAMNFKIYNRYGEMVFETYEQSIGWDGTFRNRDENSGVFQWVLEYNLANGNAGILKGNTTLIR